MMMVKIIEHIAIPLIVFACYVDIRYVKCSAPHMNNNNSQRNDSLRTLHVQEFLYKTPHIVVAAVTDDDVKTTKSRRIVTRSYNNHKNKLFNVKGFGRIVPVLIRKDTTNVNRLLVESYDWHRQIKKSDEVSEKKSKKKEKQSKIENDDNSKTVKVSKKKSNVDDIDSSIMKTNSSNSKDIESTIYNSKGKSGGKSSSSKSDDIRERDVDGSDNDEKDIGSNSDKNSNNSNSNNNKNDNPMKEKSNKSVNNMSIEKKKKKEKQKDNIASHRDDDIININIDDYFYNQIDFSMITKSKKSKKVSMNKSSKGDNKKSMKKKKKDSSKKHNDDDNKHEKIKSNPSRKKIIQTRNPQQQSSKDNVKEPSIQPRPTTMPSLHPQNNVVLQPTMIPSLQYNKEQTIIPTSEGTLSREVMTNIPTIEITLKYQISDSPTSIPSVNDIILSPCITTELQLTEAIQNITYVVDDRIQLNLCPGSTITLTSEIDITDKAFSIQCLSNNTNNNKEVVDKEEEDERCIISGNKTTRLFRGGPSFVNFIGIDFILGLEQFGSVFYIISGTVALTDCTIYNNTVTGDGGAIYVDYGGILLLDGCYIYNNYADSNGGAIYSISGVIRMNNSTFLNNDSNEYGGALCLLDSDVVISSSIFAGNTANNGGGIAVNDDNDDGSSASQVSLIGLTLFFSNSAISDGYDIYISSSSKPSGNNNSNVETFYTVTCAGNFYLFCDGINNTTIYEGTPNSTNCLTSRVDESSSASLSSSSNNERCLLNLD